MKTISSWVAIILLMLTISMLLVLVVAQEVPDHVVISEIQADSIDGTGGTDDDWIELYNPTNENINLAAGGYRIEKTKTATDPSIVMVIGDTNDGTYPGGTTVPAHGFYLIVRDDASETLKSKADAIGTSDKFTWTGTGYTLYLGTGAIGSDTDPDIIDKVGFGTATYYEGTGPAPAIPDGGSVERKSLSDSFPPNQDTNDNSEDFQILTSPSPAGTTSNRFPIADFTFSPSNPTTQDNIQFTDQSTDPDGTIQSWSWEFGDSANSKEQNPTHQYSDEGTYTVTLEVTDDAGAKGSISKEITVGSGLPGGLHHFDFDHISSPQRAGEPFSVTITAKDASGNTVTGYSGSNTLSDTTGTIHPSTTSEFTDGVWKGAVTITDADPVVTITTAGAGSSGSSNHFAVEGASSADITLVADPISVVADGASISMLSATVTDRYGNYVPDGTIVTFTTTMGSLDSTSERTQKGTAAVSLIAPSTAGVATVTATVDELSDTTTVIFTSAGVVNIIINEIAWMGTEASSSDEWIEFYNTTGYPIDIGNWSIYGADTGECLNFSDADGSTATTIPAHGYLIYANGKDDVKDSAGNNIVDIWDATIGMNNTSPGQLILYDAQNCTGNVIDTANQATDDWFAGDAANRRTMERKDPTVSGTDESNWATNDGIHRNGLDAEEKPINGTPKQSNSATNNPPIADAGPDQTVDVGDAVQLDGSGSYDPDEDPLSYSWSFVSRPAESEAVLSDPNIVNPSFVADVAGDYLLELTVDDGRGGTDSDQVTITAAPAVNHPPVADFTFSPINPTPQDTVQFTDQSNDPDGEVVAWAWDFGDGKTSTDQNPTHRYTEVGTYTVGLEVTDDGDSKGSTSQDITVESVLPGELHHFDISDIDTPQRAGEPFTIRITAQDASGRTVTSYSGINTLSDTTGTIQPSVTDEFTDGGWSGAVMITGASTAVTITTLGAGSSGTSNRFVVEGGSTTGVDLVADPVSVVAAGTGVSKLRTTITDRYGNHVPDGVVVSFTASIGRLDSTHAQTQDGIATVSLMPPSTAGVATVTAGVDGIKDTTAVIFTAAGVTVEEVKEKHLSGGGTLGEWETVTGMGRIEIEGSGTHTITTARYSANPGGIVTFNASGDFWDVHVDEETNMDVIRIYFCPAAPSTIIYYWDGTKWDRASDQVYSGGCISVTITTVTQPSLSELTRLPFASSIVTVGDINSDGYIDVIDVRLCLQIDLGFIVPTTAQASAADVDGSGEVNIDDARLLAKYIIGMTDRLGGERP